MNFEEEIKKTLYSFGEPVKIFSNNKLYEGYALFKKLSQNLEKYFDMPKQEEIGQTLNFTYSVWLTCKEKLKNIEYITKNNEKFIKLYQKFRNETGCHELLVSKST